MSENLAATHPPMCAVYMRNPCDCVIGRLRTEVRYLKAKIQELEAERDTAYARGRDAFPTTVKR